MTVIKLPFDCAIIDKKPQQVTNQISGESCILTPEAVAVYDTIKGAEIFGDVKTLRKGLDWFRKHYAREYMILLD